MFIIQHNIIFTEEKYVVVHGQLVSDSEPSLVGAYGYSFMHLYPGSHLTTPRQYCEQFDNYSDMFDWVQNNHPEQIDNVPPEEFL